MAKVTVDNLINGDTPELKDATKKAPVEGTIKKVELIPAEDLPEQFEDRENDRWEVTVAIGERELKWLPNKTSLKAIIAAYGDESDDWTGKKIGLFVVDQAVRGEMKRVPYCVIA